jgi:hypothetical protein
VACRDPLFAECFHPIEHRRDQAFVHGDAVSGERCRVPLENGVDRRSTGMFAEDEPRRAADGVLADELIDRRVDENGGRVNPRLVGEHSLADDGLLHLYWDAGSLFDGVTQ